MITLHIIHLIIALGGSFFIGWLTREHKFLDYRHKVQRFMTDTNHELTMLHIGIITFGNQRLGEEAKKRILPLIKRTDDWWKW